MDLAAERDHLRSKIRQMVSNLKEELASSNLTEDDLINLIWRTHDDLEILAHESDD